MEKYRLVQEQVADTEFQQHDSVRRQPTESGFPEIRITQQGKPRNYISYVMNLLVSTKNGGKLLK